MQRTNFSFKDVHGSSMDAWHHPGDALFNSLDGTPPADSSTDPLEGEPPVDGNADLIASNAELVSANADLVARLESATAAIQNPPAPPAAPIVPASADDTLTRFAKDPAGVMAEAARGELDATVSAQIMPLMQTLVAGQHDSTMAAQRARIDAEVGMPGTFDEVIMPLLKPSLDGLRNSNPMALADAGTITALVDRVAGQQRKEMNQREVNGAALATKTKEAQLAEVVSSLPQGSAPMSTPTAVTPDMKTFLGEVAKATGETPNEEAFLGMMNTGNTLADYIAATKPPVSA